MVWYNQTGQQNDGRCPDTVLSCLASTVVAVTTTGTTVSARTLSISNQDC